MTADFQPAVLVIDDEIQIRRSLRLTLESAGFRVSEADTGELGLSNSAAARPDGIVLDLGLPDIDGTVVLRRLREWSQIPVLVLTVRDDEEGKIGALDTGADDYLTKPFSSRELIARLRAVLRRTQPAPESAVVTFGEIEMDMAARLVRRNGAEVKADGQGICAVAPAGAAPRPGHHPSGDLAQALGTPCGGKRPLPAGANDPLAQKARDRIPTSRGT